MISVLLALAGCARSTALNVPRPYAQTVMELYRYSAYLNTNSLRREVSTWVERGSDGGGHRLHLYRNENSLPGPVAVMSLKRSGNQATRVRVRCSPPGVLSLAEGRDRDCEQTLLRDFSFFLSRPQPPVGSPP